MAMIIAELIVLSTLIFGCQGLSPKPPPPLPTTSQGVATVEVKQFLPNAYVVFHHLGSKTVNSLLVEMQSGDLVLVDAPVGDRAVDTLLSWISYRMGERRLTAIITSNRWDRASGIGRLMELGVAVHGSHAMVRALHKRAQGPMHPMNPLIPQDARPEKPQHIFSLKKGLVLNFAAEQVRVSFPGKAFCEDNVVVYFPQSRVLFAGGIIAANGQVPSSKPWAQVLRNLKKYRSDWVVPAEGRKLSPQIIDATLSVIESKLTLAS